MGASKVNVCHLLLLLAVLNLNASYPLEGTVMVKIPEGTTCDLKHDMASGTGTCVVVKQCPPAIKSLKATRNHDLARCGFRGALEVVCCPTSAILSAETDDHGKERTTSSTANVTTTTTTTPKPPLNATSKAEVRTPVIRQSARVCDDILELFDETKVSYQISGGVNAEVGEFPHMVALYYDIEEEPRYRCGGTLISDRFVLTAAHCIVNQDNKKPIRCRMGSIDTNGDDGVEIPVRKITIHEEYARKKRRNDIAIIELESSVNYTKNLHPACLYHKSDDPIGLVITGWGNVGVVDKPSQILQKGLVSPVDLAECNATYTSVPQNSLSLERNQLCAFSEARIDACQGDSGGPIQVVGPSSSVYYIIGITSFGRGCGGTFPGVYTRVYSYLDWIERIVWPK